MLSYVSPETRRQRDEAPATTALPRVPMIVVTGYLGSGKTTLIAASMRSPDMAGTAVVVSELAEAGIDQSILGEAGGDVLLLANGCLCCAGGGDLRNAVVRLIGSASDRGQPITRILVEASGAADPQPIIRQVCFDPLLRSRLRYGGVLTVFDALHGQTSLVRDPVGLRQIGLADQILVTKTDLVDAACAAAAERFLGDLNPAAAVTVRTEDAIAFVASAGRNLGRVGSPAWFGPAVETTAAATHERLLGTWSIESRAPVDWKRAEQAIRLAFDSGGDDVLRTKGLIWTDDDPRPLVIHGVGRNFHRPVRLASWEGTPLSRMVVIGFDGARSVAEALSTTICGRLL